MPPARPSPGFTVFSLALILVLLVVGLFFDRSEHAREQITEQLQYFIDPSGIKVIKDIAASAAKPTSSVLATSLGVIVALFGASGVFGQLQDALNTIRGVKPKPGAGLWGFVRTRFLSFAVVGGVCFLLLVSLTAVRLQTLRNAGVGTHARSIDPAVILLADVDASFDFQFNDYLHPASLCAAPHHCATARSPQPT